MEAAMRGLARREAAKPSAISRRRVCVVFGVQKGLSWDLWVTVRRSVKQGEEEGESGVGLYGKFGLVKTFAITPES